MASPIPFDNSYARLPAHFYARLDPIPVAAARLLMFNAPLAAELGIDTGALDDTGLAAIFAGNTVPGGAEPIAMAYAGHQFGHFVPQLGDGRAILLGEVVDRGGVRRDIQLKGSGRTPFSRGGDGRAPLGPVLREYLVSEAMHALGIPATRSLAAVATGEQVYRETALPGAVLTRIAQSHIRVGTFQYFAARGDEAAVKRLADYVIERHYPELAGAENRYLALLEAIAERQASLIARWMGVGFIHGVMNTDNMAVSGETIDFGPCAFMDAYDPATVFSSIDETGRYAFANQPLIAQWNLARLAEATLELLDAVPERAVELANGVIERFWPSFQAKLLSIMRTKLGLMSEAEGDLELIKSLLDVMRDGKADYTLTFRRLADVVADEDQVTELWGLFADPAPFEAWATSWRRRLATEPDIAPAERAAAMHGVSPAVIPRNQWVETALKSAVEDGDLAPFERLHAALGKPFETPSDPAFAAAPEPTGERYRTFCGT